MKYKIVLVPFPFDDLSSGKVRPAVCLTGPIGAYNHVILAFITSRVPETLLDSDLLIDHSDPDFPATGLKVSSTLQLHRLMTATTTYNPLTGTYQWTEFLRFLLRAAQNYRATDKLAWFVILDEMNLARVEYYFAALLSVLESGRDKDGWTREPLCMSYPDEAEGDLPPEKLYLPPNLYIVGTVNVDETTHAFSPKVLDRAFTLELTEASFIDR